MEDRTYIQALMEAPARPEYDYTAQTTCTDFLEAFQPIVQVFQQVADAISSACRRAWETLKSIFLNAGIIKPVRHSKQTRAYFAVKLRQAKRQRRRHAYSHA